MFNVVATDTAAVLAQFTTPQEAREHANTLNDSWRVAGLPHRCRIVRGAAPDAVAPDTVRLAGGLGMPYGFDGEVYVTDRTVDVPAAGMDWRRREMARGTARYMPWRDDLAGARIPDAIWSLHFPYVAVSDPTKLAYTPTEEHGMQDRQVMVRPGKYLAQFYGDVLTPAEIEAYAVQWDSEYAPRELQVTTVPDRIEWIFVHGTNSCMGGKETSYFSSAVHPCRVYAGPDLAVAYILNGSGEPSARAVVWPAQKLHSTIYGDVPRMRDALARAGYTSGSMDGARIRRIEDRSGGFVMPYVDGIAGASDNGRYIVLDGGDIETQNTCGLSEERNYCYDCDESYSDDYLHNGPDGNARCESCHNEATFSCSGCWETYMDQTSCYSEITDNTYCESCYRDTFTTCDDCSTELERENVVSDDDGNERCTDCHAEAYPDCDHCGTETEASELDETGLCPSCVESLEEEETDDLAPARSGAIHCEDTDRVYCPACDIIHAPMVPPAERRPVLDSLDPAQVGLWPGMQHSTAPWIRAEALHNIAEERRRLSDAFLHTVRLMQAGDAAAPDAMRNAMELRAHL